MDPIVDLGWVERAASRLMQLDPLLSEDDARCIGRALALQPAFKVAEPEEVVL